VDKTMRTETAGPPITVLLVDDHAVLRKGMRDILEEQQRIKVVGEARDGQEAVDLALSLAPDIILMDINMPGVNGIVATRKIKGVLPGVQVIGFSMHEDEATAKLIRSAGAAAYLRKDVAPGELVSAIYEFGSKAIPEARCGAAAPGLLGSQFSAVFRFQHQLENMLVAWRSRWDWFLMSLAATLVEDNARMTIYCMNAARWVTAGMAIPMAAGVSAVKGKASGCPKSGFRL